MKWLSLSRKLTRYNDNRLFLVSENYEGMVKASGGFILTIIFVQAAKLTANIYRQPQITRYKQGRFMEPAQSADDTLLKITKIIETESARDADKLLDEGFILLGVAKSIFDDSENRFIYSLGFSKDKSQLSEWVVNNFD